MEGNFSYFVLLVFYYYLLVLEKRGVGGWGPTICDLIKNLNSEEANGFKSDQWQILSSL